MYVQYQNLTQVCVVTFLPWSCVFNKMEIYIVSWNSYKNISLGSVTLGVGHRLGSP